VKFIGWMMDVAREQAPQPAWLEEVLRRSREAGYNALGLYLEHRFAYPSAPWAHGEGCLTPECARRLSGQARAIGLRLIPFLNTLGHMEGFIRARGGEWLAEGPASGSAQMCPSRPECVRFARDLVQDALDAFDDEWVHLGGDETRQLGQCPQCAERVRREGKAALYAGYYAPLCRFVLEHGRRPCLWGDMLLQHPEALEALPRETLIFDWQYEARPAGSTRRFRAAGFDVVCCPALHTFDAAWCDLERTQRNIDEHLHDAQKTGALGVLLTTWEFMYFASYASVLPLIYSAGARMSRGLPWDEAIRQAGGEDYAQAAEVLGRRMPALSARLARAGRDGLRGALVARVDPFDLWRIWREEACGETGEALLRLCDQVQGDLPADSPLHLPLWLHRAAVQWVRKAEEARRLYEEGRPGAALQVLRTARAVLEALEPPVAEQVGRGASVADPYRLRRMLARIDELASRLAWLAAREGSYLPPFEVLLSGHWVPHYQACWNHL